MRIFLKRYYPFLFLSIAVLYISSLSGNWKPEWDSAYYLIIAKSIIAGEGFSYLGYPCLKIPFGFPVLIAPVVYLCNTTFMWLNLYMFFFAFLALAAVFLFFKKHFSPMYAALVTVLTGWSYLVLTYSSYIMIDIPFLATSFLALYFMRNYTERPTLRYGFLTVIFILISFFLRTIGIALVAGILTFLLLHYRKLLKSVRFILLSILFLAPTVWWVVHINSVKVDTNDPVWQLIEFVTSKEEAKRYKFDDPVLKVDGPIDIVKRGVLNSGYYAGVMYSLVSAMEVDLKKENIRNQPLWFMGLIGLVGTLVLAGFIRSIGMQRMVLDTYVLFYLAVLFTWSAREPRYLIPVLPALLHYFLNGMHLVEYMLIKILPKTRRIVTTVAFWSMIGIFTWYFTAHTIRNIKTIARQHAREYYSPKMQNFLSVAAWLKDNTIRDTRVISVLAPVASLFSERRCFSFPRVENHSMLLSYMHKMNSEYVFVNPSYDKEERFLNAIVNSYNDIFIQKFRAGGAVLYEINKKELEKECLMYE